MNKSFGRISMMWTFLILATATIVGEVGLLPSQAGAATAPPPPQTAPSSPAVSKEVCLDCHGPFDKLAFATAGYQASSGEKGTPHRYVPHSSREGKAIPGCANCHEPHPVPPPSAGLKALPKGDVQWCYTACHHKNNFVSCKDCHK